MSFLMQFFSGNTKLAEEMAKNEPLLQQSLDSYFSSQEVKQEKLGDLMAGQDLKELLPAFKITLADELALILGSEKTENEIIAELHAFHTERKELEQIKGTMNYAASQDKYVYHLMQKLHEILKKEAHILKALDKHPENEQFKDAFIAQLQLEKFIADELKKVDNLSYFFKSLALGERRRHELQAEEKKIAEEMYERLIDHEIIDGQMQALNDHAITQLTADCFNELENEVMQAVANKDLVDHPHVVFEYVNCPLFEKFVHQQILSKNYKIGKSTEHVFICLFREFYNSRMEQDI